MAPTTGSTVIDVLDEAGHPISTSTRREALANGAGIRTVHVFLRDEAGRLLVQQLGTARDRHALLWGSSVAAFPRPGESEEHAANRRTDEELGLRVALTRYGTLRMQDGRSTKFVTLFEGLSSEPRRLEPGHVAGAEFRALSEIDDALMQDPNAFTETFRTLYAWWREQLAH